MIRSGEPGKMRLGLWLALFSLVVLLALILLSMGQVLKGLVRMHVQVQKIVAASDLSTHLIAQSYAIRGYMLYRDAPYLEEFRSWSRSNEREIEELLEIVRPSRKPLVRGVLARQVKYVKMCEEEIIPRVQKGDVEGAARIAWEGGAVALLREMLDATDRLREMRITDTHALVDQTVGQARRALVWGCGSGLLGLLVVLGGGAFAVRRMVMEGLVYRLMLLNITSAVAVLRRNGLVHYVNPAAENLFGLESKKVAGKPFASVFAGRMEARGDSRALPVQESLASGNAFCAEIDYTSPDGRKLAFLVDCLPLLEEGGRSHGAVLIFRDVTEFRRREEELKDLAVRDGLTLLFNHTYVTQALEREARSALEKGRGLAFMMVDVDNFKSYNDRFGHPQGDDVLRRLARLLEENVRSTDIVGRYGGDEFAVILPGAGPEEALEIAERLRRAVAAYPFPYREFMPDGRVTVSVGVACLPDDGTTAAVLIRHADEAMYSAKRISKDRVEVYQSVLKELEADWPEERALIHYISMFLAAVNAWDWYTYGHSERVTRYAVALARGLGLDAEETKKIKLAAFLHDVGKVEIPASLLNKSGLLDPEEREALKRHPLVGAEIVGQIKALEDVVPVVRHHHERWDGKGYPAGLAGEEIPLGARIIALADAFDAMTSDRPYRRAKSSSEALAEIEREAGRQFDPRLAGIFLHLFRSV